MQGFLPVLYLYMYKLSGGLVFPSETNTGLLFVTKDNVDPYLQHQDPLRGLEHRAAGGGAVRGDRRLGDGRG